MRRCPASICLLLLAVWTSISNAALGQGFPRGLPEIQNFTSKAYQWHPKNFSIVQGGNGLIYVGNSYGILEYDGKMWRKILLPKGLDGHVLSVDANGKVWVGSYGEFGSLRHLATGATTYESAAVRLEPSDDYPGEINGIWAIEDDIILATQQSVWQYRSDSLIQLAQSAEHFNYSTRIGHYYFYQEGNILNRGNLQHPDDLKNYSLDFDVAEIIATANDTLAISEIGHLFSLTSGEAKNKVLLPRGFTISKIIQLTSGYLAITSTTKGIVIVNPLWQIVHHIDSQHGLLSDQVLDLFEDHEGNLWLALDNGVSYITLNTPFTHYGLASGIKGMGYSSAEYQNRLYLGTSQGVFAYNHGGAFKPVKGGEGQVYEIRAIDSQLLVAHESGLFRLTGDQLKRISDEEKIWCIREFPGQKGLLLVGTDVGLSLVNLKDKNPRLSPSLPGFVESSRILAFDSDQKLWVCHGNKGLFRMSVDIKNQEITEVVFYSQENGKLPVYVSNVSPSRNGLLFSTENGVYQFDTTNKTFHPFKKVNEFLQHNFYVDRIVEGTFGSLWIIQDNKITKLDPLDNGSYTLLPENIIPELSGHLVGSYEHLFVHDSNNVVIGTQTGFAQFNVHANINYRMNSRDMEPKTVIREVKFESADSSFLAKTDITSPKILSHHFNNITLTYAPGYYQSREQIRFSFYLENLKMKGQSNWSSWHASNQNSFKNLSPGSYVFHVISRGDLYETSARASYPFIIQSPWYSTRTSMILYTIGLMTIGLIVYKIRVGKIKREKKEALKQKDEELQQQKLIADSEKVRLINERLKEKVSLKNKELGSVALEITKKNEFLGQLKKNLAQLSAAISNESAKKLKRSIRSIDQNMRSDNNWERFERYFDESHQDFIKKLKEKQPDLTKSSINLCAFLKLDLSTKEIASLMNISVSGVEKRRYRLRKKLDLTTDTNLKAYLDSI